MSAQVFQDDAEVHRGRWFDITVAGEVSGHYHPKASVRLRGKRVTGRAFLSDGRRLLLPSFGAYTGGLSALDPAIKRLFPKGFTAWLLGRKGIFAFPDRVLVA